MRGAVTFSSYAQNFEDVMLWRALGHVERGFYIDVGAFLPDVDSVTRAFSERGWRGINIEPHPDFIARLAAARPDDVNLAIAVGDTQGSIALHAVGRTGLATVDAESAARHAAEGWPIVRIEVPCRRLADVWDEHVPADQPVHFLKVDVEGHEAAVLRGLDWSRQRPWIVVVEATHPATKLPSHAQWQPALEAAGYRMVYWDGLNRFFLAGEQAGLAVHFDCPPNVFDDFVQDADGARDRLRQALDAARHALAQGARERADLAGRRDAAHRALAEFADECGALEARLAASEAARATLAAELAQTQAEFAHAAREADAARRERDYLIRRPFWAGVAFHHSGKPRKLVRKLLFHTSGKPRGLFRSWLLRRDGSARPAFAMWMTSPAYLGLRYPRLHHLPRLPAPIEEPPAPSPRMRHFLRRLDAVQACRTQA